MYFLLRLHNFRINSLKRSYAHLRHRPCLFASRAHLSLLELRRILVLPRYPLRHGIRDLPHLHLLQLLLNRQFLLIHQPHRLRPQLRVAPIFVHQALNLRRLRSRPSRLPQLPLLRWRLIVGVI